MELQKLYVTLMLDASDFKTGMAAVTGAVGIAVAATGAAIAGVAVEGVKAAADMEQQMADIAAVMGKTQGEIEPLGTLIKDLGLNPNLKVDATGAADAIEMLARNGLDMTEILGGAAEATVLLGNATDAELGAAANIATDAMSIFTIEAGNMTDAVNGITSVTTNSKFDINDYALALAQGGGAAATAGMEFNDFNAAIAGISPLFKSGSDAGTSFKTMITRLIPSTGPAQDAMQELGLWTEEAGSAFFDASGNMREGAEIAGLMSDAFGPLTEAQRVQAMQTIFGADAMRAAAGMMKLGEDGFRSLTDTMSQTDAMASAATRMDTVSGAMEIFEGIVDTVVLTVGQALLPVLRRFVDWLIVLADTWMPKIEAAFTTFSAVIGLFFDNLALGMEPLDAFLLAIKYFIPPELYATIENIVTVVRDFIAAVTEFLTPIWEAITSFVSFKDVLIAIGISIAATVLPIVLSLIASFAAFIAPILVLIAFVALLRNAWETDFAGIRDFVAGVWLAIQTAWEAFKLLFSGDWEGFLETIGEAWEIAWNAITEFMGNLWSIIQPKLAALWESFVTWFNDTDWVALAVTVMTTISNGLSAFWEWVSPKLAALWTAISTWFTTTDWVALAVTVMTTISNGLSAFWTWISPKLAALWTSISTWFSTIDWVALAVTLMTTVANGLDTFWDWISPKLAALWTSFVTWFEETEWIELGLTAVEFIAEGIEGLWEDYVSPVIEEFWTDLKQWFTDKAADFKGLGESIIDGIKAGVKAKAEELKQAALAVVRGAVNAVKRFLGNPKSPAPTLIPLGESVSEGLAKGITNKGGAVVGAMNSVAGKLNTEGAKKFADAADTVFKMIGSAIEAAQLLSKANFPAIVQGWHLKEQIVTFRKIVNTVMQEFDIAAGEMTEKHAKTLKAYADAADEVFGMVETALEASVLLSEFDFPAIVQGWHLKEQIIIFRKIAATVMRQFAIGAAEMREGASKQVKEFGQAATELFELVEVAIEGAIKLSQTDFGAIVQGFGLREQIIIFRKIVSTMFREFEIASAEFSPERMKAVANLSKSIEAFVTGLSKSIDGIFKAIAELQRLATAHVPGSINAIMVQMMATIGKYTTTGYHIGRAIGTSIGQGISDALKTSLPEFLQPAFAGGGATLTMEGGMRTVIVGEGAFQVTINDTMDAEEFKFNLTEIMREWTQ